MCALFVLFLHPYINILAKIDLLTRHNMPTMNQTESTFDDHRPDFGPVMAHYGMLTVTIMLTEIKRETTNNSLNTFI